MNTAKALSLNASAIGPPNNRWAPSTLAERFSSHVEKGDGCWIWTGRRNAKGYGTFGIGNKKTALAHRVAWVLDHGPIPPRTLVLHSRACTSRACVRGDHLRIGSQKENVEDARIDGRHVSVTGNQGAARGATHYRARAKAKRL